MKAFHDRTPLVIGPKDYDRWLADVDPSQLPMDLVRTYPAEGMKAWKIAKADWKRTSSAESAS